MDAWTQDRRQRAAEAIQGWRPWEHSTGPRSDEGKRASSRNAWKGGHRSMFRRMAKALREHARALL